MVILLLNFLAMCSIGGALWIFNKLEDAVNFFGIFSIIMVDITNWFFIKKFHFEKVEFLDSTYPKSS